MQNLDHALQDLKEPGFLERTVCQTEDRARLGYPDEWQFLLIGTTHDGKPYEQELVYYVAPDSSSTEEFRNEWENPVKEYKAAYPNIPVSEGRAGHNKGIHHDQRYPITSVESSRVNY